MESVDRLHMNQVYPIVLLIKFKSVKQIKEVKDSHRWSGLGGNPATGAGSSGVGLHAGMAGHGSDKISQKDAKTIFEHAQKLEAEYKHLISGTHIVQLRPNPYKQKTTPPPCRSNTYVYQISFQIPFTLEQI